MHYFFLAFPNKKEMQELEKHEVIKLKFLDIEKAKVGILTHSLQYGSGIFEGIRSYKLNNSKIGIFRLEDHIKRLFESTKIYSMGVIYSNFQLIDAVKKLLKINKLSSSYIRPFVFYNDQKIGLNTQNKKISVFIAAVKFNDYFSNKNKGITCKVSSWRRINSSILPVEAKASGNYLNSIIASNEAKIAGFDEAILLSNNGYVAEGPGENIFLVKDNVLITPDNSSDILLGITRDSIIKIAKSLKKTLKKTHYHVSFDTAFNDVIEACSAARHGGRVDNTGTWIVDDMKNAYRELHQHGVAHSVEVWHGDELTGGLYGVSMGNVFFGESMFSRQTDTSKIALVYLVMQLRQWGFGFIDCQVYSEHLGSLGARQINRPTFIDLLNKHCDQYHISKMHQGLWYCSIKREDL